MLNFLEPLQFQSETTFLEEFGDLKTDEQVCFILQSYLQVCLRSSPGSTLELRSLTFDIFVDCKRYFVSAAACWGNVADTDCIYVAVWAKWRRPIC